MSTTELCQSWQNSSLVAASMEDFESTSYTASVSRSPSRLQLKPSKTPIESIYTDMSVDSLQNSWSPPAWRKAGSGWFKQQTGTSSPVHSRTNSPVRNKGDFEEDNDMQDIDDAAEIPLPGSPTKGRSISRSLSPQRRSESPMRPAVIISPPSISCRTRCTESPEIHHVRQNNYIRFSMRADVQQRTAPIEDAISSIKSGYKRATKSRSSLLFSLASAMMAILISRFLFQQPSPGPVPDLVRVAGLAKSFEPLMHYSENGHSQVVELGETGVAVWDLGESVRSTNLTSGPIIVKELDDLSDSLKSLALELTRFFANVDGDVDGILIVMEWAQRELNKISTLPESKSSRLFSNLHLAFSKIGLLENPWTGSQTAVGKLVRDLFGPTSPQITRDTLQRTFMEFLGVLEESINNELTASISLFAHFEAIDRQFKNLQRTVVRETDAQEREESEVLASLWSRIMGANAMTLRKFEKNKELLSSLRGRTVQNKLVLSDHNSRLLQLRSNLEMLRKKLVSPLVRRNGTSSLSVQEQISGLQWTYMSLRTARDAQKARIYEMIHEGSIGGGRRTNLLRGNTGDDTITTGIADR